MPMAVTGFSQTMSVQLKIDSAMSLKFSATLTEASPTAKRRTYEITSPSALMMLSGSMPSSTPRVFSSSPFSVKPKTRTRDTPNIQNAHVGMPENIPTMEFVTRYIKRTTPAQPNCARQRRSLMIVIPVQIRAIIRWETPIVKQRSIMFL